MKKDLDQLFWDYVAFLDFDKISITTVFNILSKINISDKKKKFFIYKLKTKGQKLGYIYRMITSTAIKYGVPAVYIEECNSTKESYKFYNKHPQYNTVDERKQLKLRLEKEYRNLIRATYQMILEKQSRKEKIYSILENIKNET